MKKIEQKKICPNCDIEFISIGTESEFRRNKVRKYCSRKCANKRNMTDDIKNKISNSMKLSPFRFIPNNNKGIRSIKFICKHCGLEGFDTRYNENRKYHKECWILSAGGLRKGSSRGKSGWYKGYWCDSSYELAYLIYNLDNDIKIERNKDGFEYFFNEEKHLFYPDFIVNKKYVEIKNFRSKVTDSKLEYFPHEIEIHYKDTISPYIEYVKNKYGNDFIKLYDVLYDTKDVV